jgi:hypothetical protein
MRAVKCERTIKGAMFGLAAGKLGQIVGSSFGLRKPAGDDYLSLRQIRSNLLGD